MPSPEGVVKGELENVSTKPLVTAGVQKVEQKGESELIPPIPSPEPQIVEKVIREPTSEEEKTLLRWARHIDDYNQTYEQCMKCNNYVFMSAKDTRDSIVFECPDCGETFVLKK
jgi:predicted RNA-binding Zn-ribbon protein involved in translation (DUF1610 family)